MLGRLTSPAAGLRRHAVRQAGLTVGGQITQAVLQLGSTMVLARLLVPSDFGLIAMVAVLVGFIALFRDIGLTQAVIQQEELSRPQATGIFWTSASVTVAFAAAMTAVAPLVARFYGEPDLVGITIAFAGVFLIGGLGTMPQAMLTRNMKFSKVVSGEVFGSILGIAAAIVLALAGAGYWALVALPGVRATAVTVILWTICPWRPGRPMRGSGIGEMLRFGTNVTGFNIVNFFSRNADNVLIGWRWGADQLGQYAAAYKLLLLPLTQLNAPLTRVAVPTLARLRDDPVRYRGAYLRVVRISLSIAVPAMALAAVTADWVVAVLLGPGWELSAEVFVWLAIAGTLQPLTNTFGWLFLTQDRTREQLSVGIVTSTLAVASMVAGLPWGAVGVAMSYAIVYIFIRVPISVVWVGRRGPVSSRAIASVLALPLVLAAWSAGSALLLRLAASDLGPVVGLAVALLVAVVGSFGILGALPMGRRVLADARTFLSDFRW